MGCLSFTRSFLLVVMFSMSFAVGGYLTMWFFMER